jgi:hypothetical protein
MDSNKRRHETELLPEDFILIGKDIQNRSGQSIGLLLTEDQAFREFFCTTAVVVPKLWSFLLQQDMIPEEGTANHIMLVHFFMRAYPKEGVTCLTVGGLGGAIDPKTLQKCIWLFIHRLAEVLSAVGSFFVCFFAISHKLTHPICSRLFLRTGKGAAVSTIALLASMAPIATSLSKA